MNGGKYIFSEILFYFIFLEIIIFGNYILSENKFWSRSILELNCSFYNSVSEKQSTVMCRDC